MKRAKFEIYGENGITVKLFSKIFLQWKTKPEQKLRQIFKTPLGPIIGNKEKIIRCTLFWTFGKYSGDEDSIMYGEPDAVIITNKSVIYLEVETKALCAVPEELALRQKDYVYYQILRFFELGASLCHLKETEEFSDAKILGVSYKGKELSKYRISLNTISKIRRQEFKNKDFYVFTLSGDSSKGNAQNKLDRFSRLIGINKLPAEIKFKGFYGITIAELNGFSFNGFDTEEGGVFEGIRKSKSKRTKVAE